MRHRLEYLAVRALIAVVRVTPGVIVRGAGTALGLAFYTLDRAHRRIAHRNLATAFPARPEAERRAIARAAFEHFGRLLDGRPRSATGPRTSPPSYVLSDCASAGSAASASATPRSASASTYGSVALVSACVLVCGTAPGMLLTQ